jgi:hypothetical protein
LAPAGQKDRYTQSTQSCLDAYFSVKSNPNLKKTKWNKSLTFCVYFWQIEPEFKKTEWNKISDFSSFSFLVYQLFWLWAEMNDPGWVSTAMDRNLDSWGGLERGARPLLAPGEVGGGQP